MKYVAVRHEPQHQNVWYFKVPEELSKYVCVGNNVICDTRYGLTKGKVEYILDGVPDLIIETVGNCVPSKFIKAVETDIDMAEITIPYLFELSSPDISKLDERINDWYKSARFNTKVEFDANGVLKDGYSAYLVARMFDHNTLHGMVFANSPED